MVSVHIGSHRAFILIICPKARNHDGYVRRKGKEEKEGILNSAPNFFYFSLFFFGYCVVRGGWSCTTNRTFFETMWGEGKHAYFAPVVLCYHSGEVELFLFAQ
jgi:hypothetical protein